MRRKPVGMRIGESVFCAGYLVFALVASIIFMRHARTDTTGFASTCTFMTALLGAGDAFHLVPRIVYNLRGETRDPWEQRRRAAWLGLGNLISSITMTIFYLLLFRAMSRFPETDGTEAPQAVLVLLIALALVRIALCLSPQNHWFDHKGNQAWSIYRNIPFVAMGIITVVYLVVWYHAWLLALLVTLSFLCYMGVVLYAKRAPAFGMLMIPKTICYIWIISIFLAAL